MIPVVAIVGRPNVGKSTLFNCLTHSRDALVADVPGVTRDRQYGSASWDNTHFLVIDTGGIGQEHQSIDVLTAQQSEQAMREADVVLFLLDAQRGLLPADKTIIEQLRQLNKPLVIAVNKIDGLDPHLALAEFFSVAGNSLPLAISAAHQTGMTELVTQLATYFPPEKNLSDQQTLAPNAIKIAIAGRPNVGKSTLINRILGEARVIVADQAGTTRDSIYLPLQRLGKNYVLIDTAGVRRKSQVTENIEKLSVIKTLQAIDNANVVIFVLDAQTEVSEQDLHLLGFIIESGKALVIAVNKWDGLLFGQRQEIKRQLDRRLQFVDFAKIKFISAKHGTGVGELFKEIHQAYASATKKLPTPRLNQILQKALMAHQPPLVNGHRIKMRYAHAGGSNPPLVVIHGNQVQSLPKAYQRYLINTFRKALHLVGTPIRLAFKEGENPYKDKPNPLTERQQRKRQRLIKHRKQQKRRS